MERVEMGGLSMFDNLPLGFRFKPTDVELIDHYLRLKINGKDDQVACIKEVDICRVEPWDLPDLSAIKTYDHEWFFFCPRDRKYPNGQRSNRATGAGYWKATGKDRTIKSRKMGLIGMKKTLVFYTGRAPKGQRTHWVIHEYRPTLQELDGTNPGQGAFVLCRLFKKADDLKQDENDEGSNIEELEPNVLSPNQTIMSQEDARSELALVQASPLSVEQPGEQHMQLENNGIVKASDSTTSEATMLDHYSYSTGSFRNGSHMNEETTHEADSYRNGGVHVNVNEAMKYYHGEYQNPQPPANPEMADMEPHYSTDFGNDLTEFEFQDINGRDPISDFLESSIIYNDDPRFFDLGTQGTAMTEIDTRKSVDAMGRKKSSINESGSCSGSDVEVAQIQYDIGSIGGIPPHYNEQKLSDDDDIFSDAALDRFCNLPNEKEQFITPRSFVKPENDNYSVDSKIQIRSNHRQRELPSNFVLQGSAPRRVRLAVEPTSKVVKKESEPTPVEESYLLTESSSIAPHEDLISLAELSDAPASVGDGESCRNGGEVVESGIKIRSRPRKIQPSPGSGANQGSATRRIRLQKSFVDRLNTEDDNREALTLENSLAEVEDAPGADDESCRNEGQVVESGIKITTRARKIQPTPTPSSGIGTSNAEDNNGKALAPENRKPLMSKGFGWRPSVILVIMVVLLFVACCIGPWKSQIPVLFSS